MEREGRLTARDKHWLEHLRACGKGSLKAYAIANDVDIGALYAAKSRLKAKGALDAGTVRLVRVARPTVPSGVGGAISRVHLRNGVVVEVACAGSDFEALLASAAALP